MGYSVVNADEIELGGRTGQVRFVRRALGVEAFGINLFELPPNEPGHEHDEVDSGQEEVSFVVRGSGIWLVADGDGEARGAGARGDVHPLRPGAPVRVPLAGPDGLTFVSVGVEARLPTRRGARSSAAARPRRDGLPRPRRRRGGARARARRDALPPRRDGRGALPRGRAGARRPRRRARRACGAGSSTPSSTRRATFRASSRSRARRSRMPGRYCFVSSVSGLRGGRDDTSTRRTGPVEPSPTSEDVQAHYGELKAACERVVRDAFGHARVRRPARA